MSSLQEFNVVKCARDGINSKIQLCIDRKIKGFSNVGNKLKTNFRYAFYIIIFKADYIKKTKDKLENIG